MLILTLYLHRRLIIETSKAEADGYILKDSESQGVIDAARTVLSDLIYLSPVVSTLIVKDYIRKLDVPIPDSVQLNDLSVREREVLSLISGEKKT